MLALLKRDHGIELEGASSTIGKSSPARSSSASRDSAAYPCPGVTCSPSTPSPRRAVRRSADAEEGRAPKPTAPVLGLLACQAIRHGIAGRGGRRRAPSSGPLTVAEPHEGEVAAPVAPPPSPEPEPIQPVAVQPEVSTNRRRCARRRLSRSSRPRATSPSPIYPRPPHTRRHRASATSSAVRTADDQAASRSRTDSAGPVLSLRQASAGIAAADHQAAGGTTPASARTIPPAGGPRPVERVQIRPPTTPARYDAGHARWTSPASLTADPPAAASGASGDAAAARSQPRPFGRSDRHSDSSEREPGRHRPAASARRRRRWHRPRGAAADHSDDHARRGRR